MLIAVDIGNSHIVVAVHSGKEWIHSFRILATRRPPTSTSSSLALMNSQRSDRQDITKAVICSVVPNLTGRSQKHLCLFSIQPLMVTIR